MKFHLGNESCNSWSSFNYSTAKLPVNDKAGINQNLVPWQPGTQAVLGSDLSSWKLGKMIDREDWGNVSMLRVPLRGSSEGHL